MNNWILSGLPRSGTSMACRLLSQLEAVVALSEPLQLTDFESARDIPAAVELVARCFEEFRGDISRSGSAPSVQLGGLLNDARVEPARSDRRLRKPLSRPGRIKIDKPLTDGFHLVIKQNAAFAALLPQLKTRFRCMGLVRNPLAVLASWQTVDLPVNRGRLPGAERFDADLSTKLDAEPDSVQRQLLILDWFFSRYRDHLPDRYLLRYEDIVDTGGAVLAALLGVEAGCPEPLEQRSPGDAYPGVDVASLLERLSATEGAWRDYYGLEDCRALLTD